MNRINDQDMLKASVAGFVEIVTPEDADRFINNMQGTALIFIDSECGCAARVARPALEIALKNRVQPDSMASVFAGVCREATARVRSYFSDTPPSSPSFALMRKGELVYMIHRSDIKPSEPEAVAKLLTDAFEKYCSGDIAD